jgi:glycosyltransferase involved in cell wall biosynthesis
MIRPLILSRANPDGTGGDRRSFMILRSFLQMGLKPIVCAIENFSNQGLNELENQYEAVVIRCVPEGINSFPNVTIRMISKALNEKGIEPMDIDIIVAHHETIAHLHAAYSLSRSMKLPWTVVMQLPLSPFQGMTNSGLFSMLKWLPQRTLALSKLKKTKPLLVSDSILKEMENAGVDHLDAITLNPSLGLDHDFIDPISPRAGYDAVFFGRLTPEKGIFDIPKIWDLVVEKESNAKLAIFGRFNSFSTEEIFNRMVQERGLANSIDYVGFLEEREKFSFLKGARVFINPSMLDAHSTCVLESIKCGTPSVVYDIPAMNNYPDKFASKVDVGNIQRMADESIRIIQNDIGSSMKEQMKAFSNRYTWENAAKAELEAYRLTISAHSKR